MSFLILLVKNVCFSVSDSEVCGVFHWTEHHGHAHNADQQTS